MVTVDTNIAVYAMTKDEKAELARRLLGSVDFVSVQVLNEYVNTARRKLSRDWAQIEREIALLRRLVPEIRSIDAQANAAAVRLAARYQLAPYDAVMIAVALANGADTLYSEDMHHGLVIDGQLTIRNPFGETDAP